MKLEIRFLRAIIYVIILGSVIGLGSVIEPAVALAGYGDQNSQGSQAGTPSLTSGTPAPTPGPVRVKKVEADPAPNAPADSGTNSDATTVPAASQASAAQKRPPELQRALDEFRLQIGKLSGGANGKSMVGGRQNSLTGRLYENLRNDIMDAIPHQVRQAGGNKSLLRRNQYGATVSGPVRLPWLYDGRGRTFFSFSFEGTRERIAQSTLLTLPIVARIHKVIWVALITFTVAHM